METKKYRRDRKLYFTFRDLPLSKERYLATHPAQLVDEKEGPHWLNRVRMDEIWDAFSKELGLTEEDKRRAEELCQQGRITCANPGWNAINPHRNSSSGCPDLSFSKPIRLNLLALGDVGSTVLTGLKLLAGERIEEIGIWDMNPNQMKRWEFEMNQTAWAWEYSSAPPVRIIERGDLFDCDVLVFCASKGVPAVEPGAAPGDVRMAQYEANREMVRSLGREARREKFTGLCAVVSDPVDPLCRALFYASNQDENGTFDAAGLKPGQIQGYGLGVMNARAAYFAQKDRRFSSFLEEGRAFGPHGGDLVIANSITQYDCQLSEELTRLAAEANLAMREMGFKPYVAPALSSAVIPLLQTVSGQWHYSSYFLGGVFMGSKNRMTQGGIETEILPLPSQLEARIQTAYDRLKAIEP